MDDEWSSHGGSQMGSAVGEDAERPVLVINLVLYSILAAGVAARLGHIVYHGLRPNNVQKMVHYIVAAFVSSRLFWSVLQLTNESDTAVALRYWARSSASVCFSLAFFVVVFYLLDKVRHLSRKTKGLVAVLVAVVVGFIVLTCVVVAINPNVGAPGAPLYEASILILIGSSLVGAVAIFALFGWLVASSRIRTDGHDEGGSGETAALARASCLVGIVIVAFLDRFVVFLYRPLTGRFFNFSAFMLFGYWLPEIPPILALMYLMRQTNRASTKASLLEGHQPLFFLDADALAFDYREHVAVASDPAAMISRYHPPQFVQIDGNNSDGIDSASPAVSSADSSSDGATAAAGVDGPSLLAGRSVTMAENAFAERTSVTSVLEMEFGVELHLPKKMRAAVAVFDMPPEQALGIESDALVARKVRTGTTPIAMAPILEGARVGGSGTSVDEGGEPGFLHQATLQATSYVERPDVDRTESIMDQRLNHRFMSTLFARGAIDEAAPGLRLWFAVFNVSKDDPDTLGRRQYVGHAAVDVASFLDGPVVALPVVVRPNAGSLSRAGRRLSSVVPGGVQATLVITLVSRTASLRQHPHTIVKGYLADRADGGLLFIRETLSESPFAFRLPFLYLSMYTADRRGQLLSLQAQAARFAVETEARRRRSEAAGRQMGFSGVVVGIQEREVEQRIEAMIARLSAHIQACELALLSYTRYDEGTECLSFKPSRLKGDTALRFVATNLHLQTMAVDSMSPGLAAAPASKASLDRGETLGLNNPAHRENDSEFKRSFVTFGAPAAHVYKFKNGGLRQIRERRARHAAAVAASTGDFLGQLMVDELSLDLVLRLDVAMCQLLGAVATAVVALIDDTCGDSVLWSQFVELGILVQFESLLSSQGKELGMIGDMADAVALLRNCRIRLTRSAEIAAGDWTRMPQSVVALTEIDEANDPVRSLLAGDWVGAGGLGLVMTIAVPGEVLDSFAEDVRGGAAIPLRPIVFTQGINEKQTLANNLGATTARLQDDINAENLPLFEAYYAAWCAFREPRAAVLERTSGTMAALCTAVTSTSRRKHYEVLILAAALTQAMGGARLVSCKSAKDRTSMAVTLEQTNILVENLGLAAGTSAQHLLSVMRAAGCRRENVYKNIGKARFAFNRFQLKFLPDVYRAPRGTAGSAQS